MNSPGTGISGTAASPARESPFSSFVSNLSPIPQGNKSDLSPCPNLPSPGTVFVSPQIIDQRKIPLLKRSSTLTNIEKFSGMQADSITLKDDTLAPSPQDELSVKEKLEIASFDQWSSILNNIDGGSYVPADYQHIQHIQEVARRDSTSFDIVANEMLISNSSEFYSISKKEDNQQVDDTSIYLPPVNLQVYLQGAQVVNGIHDISRDEYVGTFHNQFAYQEGPLQHHYPMRKRLQFETDKTSSGRKNRIRSSQDNECNAFSQVLHNLDASLMGSTVTSSTMESNQSASRRSPSNPGQSAFGIPKKLHRGPLQHHYPMRKRLQFETDKTSSGRENRIRNSQDNECNAFSQVLHNLDASLMGSTVTSSTMESNQSASRRSPSNPGQSVFGIPLNNIVSVGQPTWTKGMNIAGRDSCQGEMPLSGKNNDPSRGLVNLLPSTILTGQVFLRSTARKDCALLSNASKSGSYGNLVELPPSKNGANSYQLYVDPLQSCMPPSSFPHHVTLCNTNNLPSESTRSPVSTEASPRKIRKPYEGQKCCNCKRSKCLKLYCGCFAAGAVCTEACGCLDCFNRPEYRDTVNQTKQQIQARNSLAFAPRVVKPANDPSNDNEEKKSDTIILGRHIRGCNCKRSLCLKKYCECYQAGVGCSNCCRCESCMNTFGRKDVLKHKSMVHNKGMNQIGDKYGEVDPLDNEQQKTCLSPSTPSLPCSSGPDMHKHLLPGMGDYTFGESIVASILGDGQTSTCFSVGSINKGTTEIARETKLLVSHYNQELVKPGITDEVTPSPEWDGYPDVPNLGPQLNLSPGSCITYSTSNGIEPKIIQGNSLQEPTLMTVGSLHMRCEQPGTLVPKFGESKIHLEPDSGSLESHISTELDILEQTRLPIKTVNANSPKKKRVSLPPRHLQQSTGRN